MWLEFQHKATWDLEAIGWCQLLAYLNLIIFLNHMALSPFLGFLRVIRRWAPSSLSISAIIRFFPCNGQDECLGGVWAW